MWIEGMARLPRSARASWTVKDRLNISTGEGVRPVRACSVLRSEPDPDRGELDEGQIAGGQLVVAGGDPPVLLQPAHQPLDHVPLPAQVPVHQPRRLLGLELRDDGADAMPSEVVPRGPPRVALVAPDRPRPDLGPTGPRALDRPPPHQLAE